MSDKTGSADAEGDAPIGARWESYMSQYLFTHTRAHTRELVLTQVLAAAPSSSLKVELMETSSSSCINSLSTMYHCQTLLTHTYTPTHTLPFFCSLLHLLISCHRAAFQQDSALRSSASAPLRRTRNISFLPIFLFYFSFLLLSLPQRRNCRSNLVCERPERDRRKSSAQQVCPDRWNPSFAAL